MSTLPKCDKNLRKETSLHIRRWDAETSASAVEKENCPSKINSRARLKLVNPGKSEPGSIAIQPVACNAVVYHKRIYHYFVRLRNGGTRAFG